MPCYHPILAYRGRKTNPKTGKRPLVFKPQEAWTDLPIKIPCGNCIGCRLEKARQWKVRIIHEAQLHAENSFITLTYAPENIPEGGTLEKRALQLFFKRLRKETGANLKYFACGEYGENLLRPHYHVCCMGYDAPDKTLWKADTRPDHCLYRSETLEKVWPFGFSTTGSLTPDSAGYVARYCLKKITGQNAEEHYQNRLPEFILMSRGGTHGKGLAYNWLQTYPSDVYPKDFVTINGRKERPPKYYDKLLEVENPNLLKELKANRQREQDSNPHNTPRRLEGQEKYAEAMKLRKLTRQMEETQDER